MECNLHLFTFELAMTCFAVSIKKSVKNLGKEIPTEEINIDLTLYEILGKYVKPEEIKRYN